jgi:branched-chain amino acid transport system permease protein
VHGRTGIGSISIDVDFRNARRSPSATRGGVRKMLQFVIAGLVPGGIYAIASAGLVITYTSSGILNFAFGALAFFIARFYYFLHTQHAWAIVPAAVVSIGIAGPALGVVLYALLFRHLRLSSPLIKVVATIGLLVALPSLATLIFGNQAIQQAPGLAPEPVHVYRFLGVPVTLDQVIVYICVVVTVVVGALVLRYTDVGLKVRAMVDSPAMTDLSGTNPTLVSVGVWAVSTFFAGLAGVLAAPIIGLDPDNFVLLIAASFAAVVAAKLRSLPIAVGVGLLMGIATSLFQRYLPPASAWTSEIIDAVPFIVIALVLIYNLARRGRVGEQEEWGGALDRAIMPHGESRLGGATSSVVEGTSPSFFDKYAGTFVLIVIAAALPIIVQGYWIGLIAQAFAFGIIFLSWTIVTGEGGVLWLCQITFAGIGALTTAQLANNHGWPVLAAVLAGGVVALVMGVIIGFLSIRLGDLYVALVTLTFGLLMENLVFTLPSFVNQGLGLSLNRPSFASSDTAFAYLCLVVFVLVALFIVNLRRSTTGLALNAARWSAAGARTSGISVVQMKVISGALAALIAGIGGGLLALSQTSFEPSEFATFAGVIWLAVLVTIGVRSNMAALAAGLTFVMLPALAQAYLPTWTANLLPVLFGLGAISVARWPEGVLAEHGRQWRRLLLHLRGHGRGQQPYAGGALTTATEVGSLDATSMVTEHVS